MLSHFLLRLRLFNALPNAAIQRANPPFLFNFTRVTCLDQKCLSFTCLFMCFRLFCRVSSELRPRSTGPRFRTHSSHICRWRLLAVLKSQIHRTRLSCWRSTSSFGFAGHIKVFMRALTAQFKVQSHLTVLQVLFHKVDKSTDWSLSALTNYLYSCNTERKRNHHTIKVWAKPEVSWCFWNKKWVCSLLKSDYSGRFVLIRIQTQFFL